MKQIRLSLVVAILMLAFSIPAFAGDIYGGYVQPPPQPQQTTSAGDMYGGYVQPAEQTSESSEVSPLTETALNFIQSVLSLF